MPSPRLDDSITSCFVCGKQIPHYFTFYHMAGHEEEGLIRADAHGQIGTRRASSRADPSWQWVPWVSLLASAKDGRG